MASGKPVWDFATAAQTISDAAHYAKEAIVFKETLAEYKDARETRDQWESRNAAEYGVKAGQRGKEFGTSGEQLAIDSAASGLDRSDIGLSEDKIDLDRDRIDQTQKKLWQEEKMFDVAGAGALTERDAAGAAEAAEEDAAGIAGTGVTDMGRYLGSLPAWARSFENEAKAFADPLLAGAPGTTVQGSRYGSDFRAAQGPASYARDSRLAKIDAFAAAMNQSKDPLANISLGQASQDAQMQRISREMGLAGADQSLASAGIREKIRKISEDDLAIDRKDLNIDLASLGLDKSRTGLADRKAAARHKSVTDALDSQAALDSIAQAHPKTLRGQQSVTFPGSSLLGNVANLASAFKPKKTQVTVDRTGPSQGYGGSNTSTGTNYGGGYQGR